jgi:protein O-GlcNAc transferase
MFFNSCRGLSSVRVVALLLATAGCAHAQAQPEQAQLDQAQLDQAKLDQARRLLDTPQFTQAAAILDRYLDQHPDSADAHELKGLLLYRQHQPRASMAEYLRASELADLSAFDLRIFALDCAAIPDLAEAEKWLKRSLDKDDHDAATWEALGHVYFVAQEYKAAMEALNHALEIAPHTVSAESLIGLTNERSARLDAAEVAYRRAIQWEVEKKQSDPVPYVGLGRVKIADSKPAEAVPLLQRAVNMPQATSEAHELLGQAYEKTGRSADAVKELETAIAMDPKSARLHFMLFKMLREHGENERAEAELNVYKQMKERSGP